MPDDTEIQGKAFLSKLVQYWVKNSAKKPSAASNERLICITSDHWIVYVFPSFLYVMLTAVSVFIFYLSASTSVFPSEIAMPMLLMSLACLWVVHHWFFWFLLAESETRIIVTSKRFLYISTGLLWGEETIEVAFEKMRTVEAHKTTLLQSVLNYGTLQFEMNVKIKRVPHPGTIARLIEQSMGMI